VDGHAAAWARLPGPVAVVVFGLLHFATWDSPGIYMDGVNPDYFVLRLLYGARDFSMAYVPGTLLFGTFPVLGHIYHGALPFYLGLPAYALFGTGLFGVRVAALLYASCVLLALGLFLRAARVPAVAAGAALLVLATDPAFILGFRTQFGITTLPAFLLLLALALAQHDPTPRRALLGGFCAGLAAQSYFVFLGAALAVTLLVLLQSNSRRARVLWVVGLGAGLALYLVGYALILARAGSLDGFLAIMQEQLRAQAPTRSGLGLGERLAYTLEMARLAITPTGNSMMIFGEMLPPRMEPWHWGALALAGLALCLAAFRPSGGAARGILAVLAGFLLLGLAFGDRLWAHHFASLPVWCAAAIGLSIGLLWQRLPWRAAGLAVVAVLLAGNLLSWRIAARELDRTGGRGAFSDAIPRFGAALARSPDRPFVAAADWPIVVPMMMASEGALSVHAEVAPEALRQRLCAGQDVLVAWFASHGEAPLPAWEAAIAWGAPERGSVAQRDGVTVLLTARWRAADRPASADCPPAPSR